MSDYTFYAFSENLKKIRKYRGMTQFALAEKTNISQASIANYENNLKYPTLDKIYDLARALHVSPEDLISEKISK